MPLRFKNKKVLIYAYRPSRLLPDVQGKEADELLSQRGYCTQNCGSCLSRLMKRLGESDEFPHEIGLLLGYPLKDVVGFTCGQSSPSYRGSWMVYGDVEESLKIMDLFRQGAREAERIITQSESWETCVQQICALNLALA